MKRTMISVGTLPSGALLEIPVYHFDAAGNGPRVYIQASVHGAEVQGNGVIFELLKALHKEPPLGEVTLVPMCNPWGLNLKMGESTFGRFSPVTGANWNRQYIRVPRNGFQEVFVDTHKEEPWPEIVEAFRTELLAEIQSAKKPAPFAGISTEKRLALTLQDMATQADIVLDLHTDAIAPRYLYAPEYALESAKQFGIPLVLSVPRMFSGALDEAAFMPWWDLARAFKEICGRTVPIGVEAFTVELGPFEILDLKTAVDDARFLLNYLAARGAVHSRFQTDLNPESPFICQLVNHKTIHAPKGGLVDYLVEPGSNIERGQVLARILSFQGVEKGEDLGEATTEVLSPWDGVLLSRYASAVVPEGGELVKVMARR